MDNSTNNMSEILVRYMDGELAGTEKDSLEQQLAADQNLEGELVSLQVAREAIKIYGLQQKVAVIHGDMMKEMPAPGKKTDPVVSGSTRRIIRYTIAAAASLLLIVAAVAGYNFYTLSPHKVFASNFHSYELSSMRDGDAQQVSPVEKAYREKDYKKTVEIHQLYDPNPMKETFLTGMSFVELGKDAEAIEEFNKVIEKNETAKTDLFKDEAEYYLALTYTRNGDYDFALGLLRSIKENPAHLYHDHVTGKLIRQVKMLKWR